MALFVPTSRMKPKLFTMAYNNLHTLVSFHFSPSTVVFNSIIASLAFELFPTLLSSFMSQGFCFFTCYLF